MSGFIKWDGLVLDTANAQPLVLDAAGKVDGTTEAPADIHAVPRQQCRKAARVPAGPVTQTASVMKQNMPRGVFMLERSAVVLR